MKREEWNEGLNHIDSDLVEEYVLQKDAFKQRKRSRRVWVRSVAIAACFCLVIGAIFAVPMLREDEHVIVEPAFDTESDPIIFDPVVCSEKLQGSNVDFFIGSSESIGSVISNAPPVIRFGTGSFGVKARVVKNHSDKYYKLEDGLGKLPISYIVLQMETLEVIYGKNIPKYFMYLIPENRYVDMSVYDSLLISMSQLGTENYVLKNITKNQMEYFEIPIFTDPTGVFRESQGHPELGNVIAFSDGIFDETLWQSENWHFGYQFAKRLLDNPQNQSLVVARGDSERTVIDTIKKRLNTSETQSVVSLDYTTQAAKEALEYVSTFENGVFSQMLSGDTVVFRRYINGCQTEETVTINFLTEEVIYSPVRYTKEDVAQMGNIAERLSEKSELYTHEGAIPPHISTEGKKLLYLNLYAWYVKVDNNLYGVIKTVWRYQKDDNYFIQYYDESYTLFDITQSTARDISREELVYIVGNRNIYQYGYVEYGDEIHIPI